MRWMTRGEGRMVREKYGREPYSWDFTPWYLGHFCGNAVLIGFYMPAIVWIIWLSMR